MVLPISELTSRRVARDVVSVEWEEEEASLLLGGKCEVEVEVDVDGGGGGWYFLPRRRASCRAADSRFSDVSRAAALAAYSVRSQVRRKEVSEVVGGLE